MKVDWEATRAALNRNGRMIAISRLVSGTERVRVRRKYRSVSGEK